MNKLTISGVIVGSEFDVSWAENYIAKGIVTPLSRFASALGKADPKLPVDVYINSPGGSVFAGNEMANLLLDWKRTTGQKVNVTIGAIAASMGAVLPVQAADTVSAYKNSKIMFHGASSSAWGGASAMADTADLLNKINGDIKTALVSRYGVNPDEVAAWFAEGREKWLTAAEAKAMGMVNNVLGETAAPVKATAADVAALKAKGLGISAIADGVEIEDSTPTEANNENDSGNAGNTATPPPPASGGPASEPPPAAPSNHERELEARENLILSLRTELDGAKSELGSLKSEITNLKSSLTLEQTAAANARTEAATYKTRLERMFAGAHYVPETEPTQTWAQLVAKLGYTEARRLHPDLWKKSANVKKPK